VRPATRHRLCGRSLTGWRARPAETRTVRPSRLQLPVPKAPTFMAGVAYTPTRVVARGRFIADPVRAPPEANRKDKARGCDQHRHRSARKRPGSRHTVYPSFQFPERALLPHDARTLVPRPLKQPPNTSRRARASQPTPTTPPAHSAPQHAQAFVGASARRPRSVAWCALDKSDVRVEATGEGQFGRQVPRGERMRVTHWSGARWALPPRVPPLCPGTSGVGASWVWLAASARARARGSTAIPSTPTAVISS
jgi:hypothetical protein